MGPVTPQSGRLVVLEAAGYGGRGGRGCDPAGGNGGDSYGVMTYPLVMGSGGGSVSQSGGPGGGVIVVNGEKTHILEKASGRVKRC